MGEWPGTKRQWVRVEWEEFGNPREGMRNFSQKRSSSTLEGLFVADLKFLFCKLAFSFLSREQWFQTVLRITVIFEDFTNLWIVFLFPSPQVHIQVTILATFSGSLNFVNIHRPSIHRPQNSNPSPQRLVFMKIMK